MKKLKDLKPLFLSEDLHPSLKAIVQNPNLTAKDRQKRLAMSVASLTANGEVPGITDKMPKGSSRAYLQHVDPHQATVDGVPAQFKTGTKIVIHSPLDKHHKASDYDGMSLGTMQNDVENGDGFINHHYRILINHGSDKFESNPEQGILPPLIDHDNNHQWSQIGHADDVGRAEFQQLTKAPGYPKGIKHNDFVGALIRNYNRNNGRYFPGKPAEESHLDHIDEHPLTQKFLDYYNMTGHMPHDLQQIKNMGVFTHPNGTKYIVARDHGFSPDVAKAYQQAFMRRVKMPAYR